MLLKLNYYKLSFKFDTSDFCSGSDTLDDTRATFYPNRPPSEAAYACRDPSTGFDRWETGPPTGNRHRRQWKKRRTTCT
jgi:hypothetical protein